jgi:hypothetical protein
MLWLVKFVALTYLSIGAVGIRVVGGRFWTRTVETYWHVMAFLGSAL